MTDGISLEKGQRINLSKEVESLKKIRAVIGWRNNSTDTGADFDVDVSAFVCKYDGAGVPKLIGNKWFIFYNELKSPDGAVVHQGDNRTGAVDGGDCESITVNLATIDSIVDEISFVVTIDKADLRKQNFGQVKNAGIRIINEDTGNVIAKFDLSEDFSIETAVQVGSLYRKNGDWLFQAVGAGYKTGLGSFVIEYGGNVS